MIQRVMKLLLLGLIALSISTAQDKVKELEGILQQEPNDIGTLITLGRIYHDQAVGGNEGAVDKGFACFDKVLQIDPANAVAFVYRGSFWTLRGRDAWWPFTKAKDVDKGVDDMDKAADLAPTDITIRIVRGITSVQLPSMFRRLPTALKDFEFLMNDARFVHFDAHLQATIYYWAGIAYKNDGQPARAKELLQEAVTADPNSDMSRKAESELKQLS